MKLLPFCLVVIFQAVIPVQSQEDNSWMYWKNEVGKRRWFMYHLEKEDVARLRERWDTVGTSIGNSANRFAGTYYQPGFMSGYFLRWSPEKGFIFITYFDVEHPCYFSSGDVVVETPVIRFVQKIEAKNSICPSNTTMPAPEKWIPVLGGEWLIPLNEVDKFADFYAGVGEFNGFVRKFREGYPFAYRWERDFKPENRFVLPREFAKNEKKQFTGQIVAVGNARVERIEDIFLFDKKVSVTPVEINLGSKDRLSKGQEFILLSDDDGAYETLIVTSVGRNRSKGKLIRKIENNGKEGYLTWDEKTEEFIYTQFKPARVGQRITSSPMSKL